MPKAVFMIVGKIFKGGATRRFFQNFAGRGPKVVNLFFTLETKGSFTLNLVMAYDLAYGQRQSSHQLHWPCKFSRFRPAYLKLF